MIFFYKLCRTCRKVKILDKIFIAIQDKVTNILNRSIVFSHKYMFWIFRIVFQKGTHVSSNYADILKKF